MPGAPIDAVVVLGAAVSAPGVPGPALQRRLIHGVGEFRARAAGHLVLSGGIVAHPPAEACVMRDLARGMGVAESAIVIEDRARNTFENAVFTGRILRERGWRKLLVVTDEWHLPRALYIFRRLGLPVSGAGVPPPAGLPLLSRLRRHLDERVRLANCAYLFARGRHKPILRAEWQTD